MANAKKLSKDGNWRVLVYAGKDASGKRQYKSFTESTERKANLAAMEWQEHYKAITSDGANMTVSEAIDAHIASLSNILSPATIAGYHRIQKSHLKVILTVKLVKLTEKIIKNEVNNEAGKYSPKTVYNAFGLLNTVLKKYRPDFKYRIDLPTVYPTIKDVPLDDDLRKIYVLAYGTEMELPILLASWLGLRVSEIRGLKCSKMGNGKVVVEKAIVQGDDGAVEKGTKSKKGTRAISFPAYIQQRMDVLITDDRKYITSLSGQAIYKRFVRICSRAGVGPFRFHDLRHTNATIMLEENVPDKYIAERGGWGSDIYKKRYEHTTINKRQSINEAIDSRFEKIMQHEMQHDD
jgi:integrase